LELWSGPSIFTMAALATVMLTLTVLILLWRCLREVSKGVHQIDNNVCFGLSQCIPHLVMIVTITWEIPVIIVAW
jgi:hypothetical protein